KRADGLSGSFFLGHKIGCRWSCSELGAHQGQQHRTDREGPGPGTGGQRMQVGTWTADLFVRVQAGGDHGCCGSWPERRTAVVPRFSADAEEGADEICGLQQFAPAGDRGAAVVGDCRAGRKSLLEAHVFLTTVTLMERWRRFRDRGNGLIFRIWIL